MRKIVGALFAPSVFDGHSMVLSLVFPALSTHTLHYVVDAVQGESVRELYSGDMLFLQAEGTVTYGAEGVHMVAMVVIAVFIVIHAEAVFAVSAAVLESVQQVVLFKKGERAEDAAAIHRRQQILYIGQ